MLTPVEKILFFVLAVGSLYLAWRSFRQAARIIQRGDGKLHMEDLPRRIWRALEVAVTQRTVFRARPGSSLMHGFIVWGFLFYFLANAGDLLEGYFDIDFLGTGDYWGCVPAGGGYSQRVDHHRDDLFPGAALRGERPGADLSRECQAASPQCYQAVRRDSLIVGAFILVHVGGALPGRNVLGRAARWQ